MATQKKAAVKKVVVSQPKANANMRVWKFGDDIDTDAIIPEGSSPSTTRTSWQSTHSREPATSLQRRFRKAT